MKKLGTLLLVVGLLVFGGLLVRNTVNADSSTTSTTFPWFHMNETSSWTGFGGCRGEGYGGMIYDGDEEFDQTFVMLFPSLDGIDSLVGETFTVTVYNPDSTVYSVTDVTALPSGAVGVYVPVDFTGSITLDYAGFTGSADIDFTSSVPCLAYRTEVTLN